MTRTRIDIPLDAIEAFCKKWKVTELSLFGSVLRDDFGPDSDIDVLVAFAPDSTCSYWDWPSMQEQLSEIFGGRRIDLFTKNGVRESRNPWRKHEILSTSRQVYPAA